MFSTTLAKRCPSFLFRFFLFYFATCHPFLDARQEEKYRFVPAEIRKEIEPYLLPSNHPVKPVLDQIFQASRVTLNSNSLKKAGFEILFSQPRSYIRVVSHPKLLGYLLKINLDSELRLKKDLPEWKWFIRRCEVAEIIQKVIKTKKLKYFKVPKKYIYVLPERPMPPIDPKYARKYVLLVVERMNLISSQENKMAWRTAVTKQHLEELYIILSHCPYMTLRLDNLVFTVEGKIAFIDTEWRFKFPNFFGFEDCLSTKMREYWNKIIRNGGKP